jgi:FAD:protein FMN transferase
LATSGDARRYLLKNGMRSGHILSPKPAGQLPAPRSVTVAAATCTEAGMLSALAMPQGKAVKSFYKMKAYPFGVPAKLHSKNHFIIRNIKAVIKTNEEFL